MRGHYDHLLRQRLRQALQTGHYTQDSVAAAVGMHQTQLGAVINGKGQKSLDLDQADAALTHCGSSLRALVTESADPDVSRAQRLLNVLGLRADVLPLVEALLDVPHAQLHGILTATVALARGATAQLALPPRAKPAGETAPARKTRAAKPRR